MSHVNYLYFQSTLEIVETAWEYITQLKAQAQTTMDMTEDAQSKNRSEYSYLFYYILQGCFFPSYLTDFSSFPLIKIFRKLQDTVRTVKKKITGHGQNS